MNLKNVLVLGVMLLGLLAFSVSASAIAARIVSVELDDTALSETGVNQFSMNVDKGDSLQLKVTVEADADIDDAEISAFIRGIDINEDVDEGTRVFNMKANTTYTKKLTLVFSERLDRDDYTLRVELASKSGASDTNTYELRVGSSEKHKVAIRDITLDPYGGVQAGRALLVTARVQNYGNDVEDNVKVVVSVPELGLQGVDYIDELKEDGDDDDSKSTEEIYLRVPPCAKPGVYDLTVRVFFNDGDDVTTKTVPLTVLADDSCPATMPPSAGGKAYVSIGADTQTVAPGQTATYPVTITNTGAAKTFTVGVTGGDWATFPVTPSNVVTVGDGETRTVYVQVTPNKNAAPGEHLFGVTLSADGAVVREVTLKAMVAGEPVAAKPNLRRVLEVGIIVLVIVLVILGLIVGFNKLKGNEGEGESQSYY